MQSTRRTSLPSLAGLLVVLLATLTAVWPAVARAATPVPAAEAVWGANYFPNVPLVTHEGKSVRFFDDLIKGKVVAINFIYTTCAYACPLETARLREVAALLGDRMGRDVFFVSITIDPRNDTPRVLKQYAETFQAGPGWTFLTGKEEDIIDLRKSLGLYMPQDDKNPKDHNLSLIVGNQSTGIWRRASPYENPYMLSELIGSSLHNWKYASNYNNESYATAPTRLTAQSRGEQLFRTRCASCHTTGAVAGSPAALQRIGPDLAGVSERRERNWLGRWISAPDKMLADKDPLAMQLFEQYNKIAMPNLRLNDVEVEALLDYLRDEVGSTGKHLALE